MKKLSLLSLLLLSSTSCLASGAMGYAAMSGFAQALKLVAIAFMLSYFFINLLLLFFFSRFLLKDKNITLKRLSAASVLAPIVAALPIMGLFYISPGTSFLNPYLLATVTAVHTLLLLLIHIWLFSGVSKKSIFFMTLFVYLLNPIQWKLNLIMIEKTHRRPSQAELSEIAPDQENF